MIFKNIIKETQFYWGKSKGKWLSVEFIWIYDFAIRDYFHVLISFFIPVYKMAV
jgi:hypothetical protein